MRFGNRVRPRQIPLYAEEWPAQPVQWATAVSAWGDTFVACGRIQELISRTGQEQIGVLYYGKHSHIADYLRFQPWCREVRWRAPSSHEALVRAADYQCAADFPVAAPEIVGLAPTESIWPTHIRYQGERVAEVHPYRDGLLPRAAWEWATAIRSTLPPQTYFLHPWSFQSAALEHHWPHWRDFVYWLPRSTNATFILTGYGYDPDLFEAHPRLINLVGETKHMHEVLALACLCRGVISTCNSVALWSAVRRLNAFVLNNRAIPNRQNQFYRFIAAGENVSYHWHDERLVDTLLAAQEWLD